MGSAFLAPPKQSIVCLGLGRLGWVVSAPVQRKDPKPSTVSRGLLHRSSRPPRNKHREALKALNTFPGFNWWMAITLWGISKKQGTLPAILIQNGESLRGHEPEAFLV